MIDTFKHFNC